LRRRSDEAANEPRIVRPSRGDQHEEDDEDDTPAPPRRSSPIIEVFKPKAREKSSRRDEQAEFSFQTGGNFRLPAAGLLGKHDDRNTHIDEKALKDSSAILE